MANSWGTNPIILDTASTDATYDATHDAHRATGTAGTQYTTGKVSVQAIKVVGVNTDAVVLQSCTPDASVDNGDVIYTHALETGRLYNHETFPRDLTTNGIFIKTLSAGAKVYLYV